MHDFDPRKMKSDAAAARPPPMVNTAPRQYTKQFVLVQVSATVRRFQRELRELIVAQT